MKKLNFILLIMFWLQSFVFSQTIIGGCDEVTVLSVPTYDHNLIINGGWKNCPKCDPCERLLLTSPPIFMQTKHWLEKKDNSSGNGWTVVDGPIYGDNSIFTNVSKGTYRVRT